MSQFALRNLIPGVLLGLGVMIIVVSSLFDLRNGLALSEERSLGRLKDLMSFVVSDLEAEHRFGATQHTGNYLRTLTRYRAVDSALVVGPSNQVRHATDYVALGNSILDTPFASYVAEIDTTRTTQAVITLRDGDALIGIAPVAWTLLKGELLPSRTGALLMRYDMSAEIANELNEAARTTFTLTIATLLFAAGVAWFFQRVIGRDIRSLLTAAEAVAQRSEMPPASMRLREFQSIRDGLTKTREIIEEHLLSLEISESRFRDIVESSDDWILEADNDWRIRYSNAVVARLLGYEAAEILGRPLKDFLVGERRNLLYFEELLSKQRFRDVHLELSTRSGEARLFRISGYRRDEPLAQVRIIASDITEQQRMERIVLQSQKMDAVGQLAGGIAHDFNNSLTIILSRCDLVLENFDLVPALQDEIAAIRDHALSSSQLTKRLLMIARRDISAPRVFLVNEAISQCERMLRSAAGENIEVELRLDDDVPCINMDPVQFEQMLLNLTMNARNAMSAGGRVVIRTQLNNRSLPDSGEAEPVVNIHFSDTGSGIDPAIVDRVFEPFFSTRDGDGTGLGLTSVFNSVRGAGGTVLVESMPGEGTIFRIALPAVESSRLTVPPDISPRNQRTDARLLVIDDLALLRRPICSYLRQNGFEVFEADGIGNAALVLERETVDLVITDIMLKDGNGIAWFASLSDPPPVIFMSGYASPESTTQIVLEAGRNFINKPFELSELIKMIQVATSRDVA